MLKIITQGAYSNHVEVIDVKEYKRSEIEATDKADESDKVGKIGVTSGHLLTSEFEGNASIYFDINTYEIIDTRWSIHRAPDRERRGEGKATMLHGESVYLEDHANSISILPDYSRVVDYKGPPGGWKDVPQHKAVLLTKDEFCPDDDKERAKAEKKNVSWEWQKIRTLFTEAMVGPYQAESFLLNERGYTDYYDYGDYWMNLKIPDYCLPYATMNLDIQLSWMDTTGTSQYYPKENLYNKYIQYTVCDRGDDIAEALATYNDSFHEMSVEMSYRISTGEILSVESDAQRMPFAPCWTIRERANGAFVGGNIYEINKRDVSKVLGGENGCWHMLDMVAYIATAVQDKRMLDAVGKQDGLYSRPYED